MLRMPLRQSNTSVTFHKITQTALAMDAKWTLSKAGQKIMFDPNNFLLDRLGDYQT